MASPEEKASHNHYNIDKKERGKIMYKINVKCNENNECVATLKTVEMNIHSSVIDRSKFEAIFTREMARKDIAVCRLHEIQKTITEEETCKMNALANEYFNNVPVENIALTTCVGDIANELRELLFATLYVQNAVINGLRHKDGTKWNKSDKTIDDLSLIYPTISYGMKDFYTACKTAVADIENGSESIENVVKSLKPLYNDCTTRINHDAVKDVCKKWIESTKEKNTRAFLLGLCNRYKVTRTNHIKKDSPLSTIDKFEKYVLMWLVTEGNMNEKKQKASKDTISNISAFC